MTPSVSFDPRAVCMSLPDMHSRLNAIRSNPALEHALPGAMVFMRPGQDNPFPSSAANRVLVYDASAAPLTKTAAAARDILTQHGVRHWFIEIGAGGDATTIENVRQDLHARYWPHVRYPVLARRPAVLPTPASSLTIRRITPEDARAHAADIDLIWGKPGAAAPMIAAAERPGYEAVVGFDGGRAVAMGILIHTGNPGGVCYLASGGTHPDYRRGGQSAIIAERVRIAHELECGMCVSETVLTDPTSTQNLLRAGFEFVCEWAVLEVGKSEVGDSTESANH